jgi:hypothetical protein
MRADFEENGSTWITQQQKSFPLEIHLITFSVNGEQPALRLSERQPIKSSSISKSRPRNCNANFRSNYTLGIVSVFRHPLSR